MNWNPLSTLTGRLMLVTFAAVIISSAVGFAMYATERGFELRRAALMSAAERIAFNVERLRQTPAAQRASLAGHFREVLIGYSVDPVPQLRTTQNEGPAARVASLLNERLHDTEVRVASHEADISPRWFRDSNADPNERGPGGTVSVTALSVSVEIDDSSWLNVRAFLPAPPPPPTTGVGGLLALLVAVALGAALVARQIGKPLAQLADAAQAFGAGDTQVTAPVSGPDDVRRASTAFNAMAARLGRQLDRQRQMLWALSHDLRTPITALRLRAELIEDDALRQRLLAPIDEMEQLTEEALSLARAGASEEARHVVDIAEIVRTLCGELMDMGVNVRADAPEAVSADVRPTEIARALRNLAENAAKYGGGGVMRVSRTGAGEIQVEVVDSGPGVPQDVLTRLAEPFFRADAARSAKHGAGLGLAIAQAIADSHGGRLEFKNRTPRGFSAKLILPAARASAAQTDPIPRDALVR